MQALEYRAKAYHQPNGKPDGDSAIIYSGHATLEQASAILGHLLQIPSVTGGHLEKSIQGVGWVMADDSQEEIERRAMDRDTLYPNT